MKQGVRTKVVAEIHFQASEDLPDENPDLDSEETVKVSPRETCVYLTGDPVVFSVDSAQDLPCMVLAKPITEWIWDVTPHRSGEHELRLQVFAQVEVEPGEYRRVRIETADVAIDVEVNRRFVVITFLGEHWPWLLGGLGMFLLATWKIWFEWLLKKRKAEGNPPQANQG